MKHEIGSTLPEHLIPDWPGQYEIFSHFEFVCGIPQSVFAVTTRKENGLPNVCLQSWSSFSGGKEGYFVVLGGLSKYSHTYRNILRDGEFCVNFLPLSCYDALQRSIEHNEDNADELSVCGLTQEAAKTVSAPRIAEAFLSLECTLHQNVPISGSEQLGLLIGRVQLAAIDERYSHGIDEKYGKDGFFYNVHSPVDLKSGKCAPVGFATLKIDKTL